jgi:hypothetical protein
MYYLTKQIQEYPFYFQLLMFPYVPALLKI